MVTSTDQDCVTAVRAYRAWWAEYRQSGQTELESQLCAKSQSLWQTLTREQYALALAWIAGGSKHAPSR